MNSKDKGAQYKGTQYPLNNISGILMNNSDILFRNKKLNPEKLLAFGFCEDDGRYTYSTNIADNQFRMIVIVTDDGALATQVIDASSDEEYVLHRISEAVGSFVGAVKSDYKNVLQEIAKKCFEPDVFRREYTKKIIQYVRDTYHDELEFLWQPHSNNAIFRRKDTGKWYGALLVLSKRKLGLDSDNIIDILDLRMETGAILSKIDRKKYFPGYHMNKKHWVTICLDGSVPLSEISERIDASYELAVKRMK